MPTFTKRAIIESFLRLVGKKTLDKITVRDLVDDCGINRNTFYYYFQDIYAVMEEICSMALSTVPQSESLSVTLCSFFRTLGESAVRYPKSARGFLLSLGSEGIERYFAPALDRTIAVCLRRSAPSIEARYCRHLSAFVRHASFGLFIDFVKDPKGETLEEMLFDLSRILTAIVSTLDGEK